jgi:hypothetical protein
MLILAYVWKRVAITHAVSLSVYLTLMFVYVVGSIIFMRLDMGNICHKYLA